MPPHQGIKNLLDSDADRIVTIEGVLSIASEARHFLINRLIQIIKNAADLKEDSLKNFAEEAKDTKNYINEWEKKYLSIVHQMNEPRSDKYQR